MGASSLARCSHLAELSLTMLIADLPVAIARPSFVTQAIPLAVASVIINNRGALQDCFEHKVACRAAVGNIPNIEPVVGRERCKLRAIGAEGGYAGRVRSDIQGQSLPALFLRQIVEADIWCAARSGEPSTIMTDREA